MIPQIIILAVGLVMIGVHLAKHGEAKKPEKYNAYTEVVAQLVSWGLLYWGGFFDVFGK